MSFKNAEIKKKANIYNGGEVTSRTIITAEGESKTLGIMLPGTYHFNTAAAEIMELLGGSCRVRPAGELHWQDYAEGEFFNIPANSSFDIEVTELLDYICHFE
ncbi:MAG TPA: pyrimidine/purine nucleoside phosphorylase [Mariprofundaceae bacterium]|nr:pyrimidine/purine nucleoside phosphorylase [Mariprofundaceae bacterium]